ncbi:hypothetical protein ACPRNU_02460 [Chromobacterium vaccinii]|uniref:hypothetical protein n=1 Tax=Chromobacterium TaxID=535 RepID=UPI00130514FC|nr:hypothetical protein [Chromobacterium sp. ATCC 53434]
MRDLAQFTVGEWLRLQPCQDALKQWRNDIWQRHYQSLRVEGQAAFLDGLAGQTQGLGLVVAFEQPWALNWQLKMARVHLSDMRLLVFDNSRRPEMRRQIAEVCRANDVPYLGLPVNPTRHVNRSHGFAMNWIYHNVVRELRPAHFAFIDHDMIPVLDSSCFRPLAAQAVYGLPNVSEWAWQLWAGYCAFDGAFVENRALNFLYDFSNGLDTGGRNWRPVYRELPRARLKMADRAFPEVADPLSGALAKVEMIDNSWFHIGNISYNNVFQQKAELCQNLAAALDEGATWLELCPSLTAGRSE